VLTSRPARRKPEHRAQFQAHHLRGPAGVAWYIGRRILRRPRQAAARLTRRRCTRAGLGSVATVTLSIEETFMRKWIMQPFCWRLSPVVRAPEERPPR
jgi:hypothetical protein